MKGEIHLSFLILPIKNLFINYLFKNIKVAQNWQNCFIKTTKSLDITKVNLILKTSVSARVPWVRIPPTPFCKVLEKIDFF